MIEQVNGFITPMKGWDAVGKNDGKIANLSLKMEYSVDNRTWIDANTEVLTNLPDGDYYGAAASFLNSVEVFYEQGIDTNQYNYDPVTGKISRYHSITFLEFLFALAVAVICGLVAVGRVKREYGGKNDNSKLAANFKLSYRKDSSYRAGSAIADVLINSYITQQIIQKQQSSSSGSGGSSTAGRSTTHTSSSGRTHGGGGRKF